jgi:TPR repeat protein
MGNLDSMYELALDRMFESVQQRSMEYLEEAESYLKRAASEGHVRAAEFLIRVWPSEKEARRRQIRDGL